MYRLLIRYFGAQGKRHKIRDRLKLIELLGMGIGC